VLDSRRDCLNFMGFLITSSLYLQFCLYRNFGYQTDFLFAYRGHFDDKEICASYYEDEEWCNYSSTYLFNGTSAYIDDVDDLYYLDGYEFDQLDEEVIRLTDVAGTHHQLCAYHWFDLEDIDNDNPTWQDHVMPATLSVKKNGIDMGGQWSHPVDLHVSADPEYEAVFCITVACSTLCECSAGNYTLYDSGFDYYMDDDNYDDDDDDDFE
jgi:hypothetical protein